MLLHQLFQRADSIQCGDNDKDNDRKGNPAKMIDKRGFTIGSSKLPKPELDMMIEWKKTRRGLPRLVMTF